MGSFHVVIYPKRFGMHTGQPLYRYAVFIKRLGKITGGLYHAVTFACRREYLRRTVRRRITPRSLDCWPMPFRERVAQM